MTLSLGSWLSTCRSAFASPPRVSIKASWSAEKFKGDTATAAQIDSMATFAEAVE